MNSSFTGNSASATPKTKKIVLAVVIVALVVITAATAFVVVPAGSTGVVVTLGKVGDKVLQEGFHLKMPFVQQVEIISNKIQVVEIEANAVSKDLQAISATISVNCRVGLESSAFIYKNIGSDYQTIVLLPAVQESVKSVTARYTAEELITLRAQVSVEIKEALEQKVTEYGIIIEKFNIVNFDFSAEFNQAIEDKQVAEQNLIKTQTEQEQAIVIAQAEARQKIIAAEAAAEAILTEAQAQAEANALLTASLNDQLIEYQKVDKWDGAMPDAVLGSEAGIIMDMP